MPNGDARDELEPTKPSGGRIGLEVDELDFGISSYTGRTRSKPYEFPRGADLISFGSSN